MKIPGLFLVYTSLKGISGILGNNFPLSFSTALALHPRPQCETAKCEDPGLLFAVFFARTSGIFAQNPPPKCCVGH